MSEQPQSVILDCAKCGQKLRIPADRLEQVGRCPRCECTFEVVRQPAPPAPEIIPPPPLPPISQGFNRRRLLRIAAVTAASGGAIWAVWRWGFSSGDSDRDFLPDNYQPRRPKAAVAPPADDSDPPEWRAEETLRVACVGDSITFGSGLDDRESTSYPAVLQELLGRRYEVKNFASPGRSALAASDYPYAKEQVYQDALDYRPHIVTIMLGTNDAWPQNWAHSADFVGDLKRLATSFRSPRLRTRVYLCTPPPTWPGGPLSPTRIRDEVVPKVKEAAEQLRLRVIDVHSALSDRGSLFPDKLHPNQVGAREIATLIANTIKESAAKA